MIVLILNTYKIVVGCPTANHTKHKIKNEHAATIYYKMWYGIYAVSFNKEKKTKENKNKKGRFVRNSLSMMCFVFLQFIVVK